MDYTKQIDYSSLSTYLDCPRKFMFRYIMHLERTGVPSLDLVFGSCWHYGMEMAFKSLVSDNSLTSAELTEIAILNFRILWNAQAAEFFDEDSCFPKNPGRAHDMFYTYFNRFLSEFKEYNILGVEDGFTVSLSSAFGHSELPDYIGKLDLIADTPTGLVIFDHKTAKFANDTTFNGFEQSLQTDGYLTAGHIYFDSLPKITYHVALCQKTKIDFFPYTISRRIAAIDRFLDDLVSHTNKILQNIYLFKEAEQHSNKLYNPPYFRRNPGYACTQYFRKCDYFDICMMRNNPIEWATSPPQGYKISEWHPDNVAPERILEGSP